MRLFKYALYITMIWAVSASAQVNVDVAPLFSAPDIKGDTVNLSKILSAKQYVLLVLLASFT